MRFNEPIVYVSDIDEDRFGIKIAKALRVTLENLPEIMGFCRSNNVIMLIARCSTNDFPALHSMEREGFCLMDTLLYYSVDLKNVPNLVNTGEVSIRNVQSGEEDKVKAIADEAFRGYFGHYHADERLDNAKCDEVYVSWAVYSCISHDFADEVLVAELNGRVVGFATLRINSPDESEGVLFCVDSSAQRMGIYRSFMIQGMRWSVSKGMKSMVVSTQLINTRVQKVWTRLGFEIRDSYYTLHKWFD